MFVSAVSYTSSNTSIKKLSPLLGPDKILEQYMKELLAIENYTDGDGNRIITQSEKQHCKGVHFYGKNNTIIVDENVILQKQCFFRFYLDNAIVHIKKNCNIAITAIIGADSVIEFGEGCTTANLCFITVSEGAKVIVGDDCMFASENQLRSCDSHRIYSTLEKNEINISKDIIVGKHVWIGLRACLLGGSEIGQGAIVGLGAVVKKKFPNNCCIAGNPAFIVKRHISWERLHKNEPNTFLPDTAKYYWDITREKTTSLQQFLLTLYLPIVYFFSSVNNYKIYRNEPQVFFLRTKHPLKLYVRKILNKCGPPIF